MAFTRSGLIDVAKVCAQNSKRPTQVNPGGWQADGMSPLINQGQ